MLHSLNLNKLVKSVLFKPGSGGIGNTAYRYVPENLEPPYWGTQDVAEYFGISMQRVRQLVVNQDIGSCFQLPDDNRFFFYIEGTKKWLLDNAECLQPRKTWKDSQADSGKRDHHERKHGSVAFYDAGCRCHKCISANLTEPQLESNRAVA